MRYECKQGGGEFEKECNLYSKHLKRKPLITHWCTLTSVLILVVFIVTVF